jgi:hypothetical protein
MSASGKCLSTQIPWVLVQFARSFNLFWCVLVLILSPNVFTEINSLSLCPCPSRFIGVCSMKRSYVANYSILHLLCGIKIHQQSESEFGTLCQNKPFKCCLMRSLDISSTTSTANINCSVILFCTLLDLLELGGIPYIKMVIHFLAMDISYSWSLILVTGLTDPMLRRNYHWMTRRYNKVG